MDGGRESDGKDGREPLPLEGKRISQEMDRMTELNSQKNHQFGDRCPRADG